MGGCQDLMHLPCRVGMRLPLQHLRVIACRGALSAGDPSTINGRWNWPMIKHKHACDVNPVAKSQND
jgi:hypothetical protein